MESKYLDRVLEILNKNDGIQLDEDERLLKGKLKEYYQASKLLNLDLVSKQTKAKNYFQTQKAKSKKSVTSAKRQASFKKKIQDLNKSVIQ